MDRPWGRNKIRRGEQYVDNVNPIEWEDGLVGAERRIVVIVYISFDTIKANCLENERLLCQR